MEGWILGCSLTNNLSRGVCVKISMKSTKAGECNETI